MSKRPLIPALAAACALAVPAASAHAQDARVIAAGVSVAGVDVSNLTVDQAAAKLDQALTPTLMQDTVVGVAGRHFTLSAGQAKVKFDTLTTAKRAFYAGQKPGTPVVLALTHSKLSVRAFAATIGKQVDRAPRDATVGITVKRMSVRPSKPGFRADRTAIAGAIDTALGDPAVSRALHFKVVPLAAKVNANTVRRRYGTIVTIDRANHTLRLFKQLKFVKRYGVAVGMAGLETPAGLYSIHDKQVNPAWHVPNSSWAGSLAGQTIPGGAPNNPLKARWMGIANGVGIHGTAEDWSIGSNASHGCIRMHVGDVIDLFRRVPVGATVLIK